MNKALSILDELRPRIMNRFIGYDSIFDSLAKGFDEDVFFNTSGNFPSYDIQKTGANTYDVFLAVAGFGRKDLNISVQDGMLTIESAKDEKAKEKDENGTLYKGIAKRYFKKSFSLEENCEVSGASLRDGLLKISILRLQPEAQKAKIIEIK